MRARRAAILLLLAGVAHADSNGVPAGAEFQVNTYTANTSFVAGATYVGVLEVFDQNVSFSVDGRPVVGGMTVDQSAFPKNHLVLAAYGASVTYDDVKIWEALAP